MLYVNYGLTFSRKVLLTNDHLSGESVLPSISYIMMSQSWEGIKLTVSVQSLTIICVSSLWAFPFSEFLITLPCFYALGDMFFGSLITSQTICSILCSFLAALHSIWSCIYWMCFPTYPVENLSSGCHRYIEPISDCIPHETGLCIWPNLWVVPIRWTIRTKIVVVPTVEHHMIHYKWLCIWMWSYASDGTRGGDNISLVHMHLWIFGDLNQYLNLFTTALSLAKSSDC